MVTWFWQRKKPRRALKLRSRGELGDATRVDFAELAPELDRFLGQAAYLQLGYFETLSRMIRATPDLVEKESISRAAAAALDKHRQIVEVMRERGADPTELMLPFQEGLDAFRRKTIGARQRETLLAVYITAGILDDFYLALASSYGDTGERVAEILSEDDAHQDVVRILRATIDSDPEWRSLLSMWARRLVGDTILVARARCGQSGSPSRTRSAWSPSTPSSCPRTRAGWTDSDWPASRSRRGPRSRGSSRAGHGLVLYEGGEPVADLGRRARELELRGSMCHDHGSLTLASPRTTIPLGMAATSSPARSLSACSTNSGVTSSTLKVSEPATSKVATGLAGSEAQLESASRPTASRASVRREAFMTRA
ncbi:ferritin-like fold-containing protein [Microbacterium sp. NIBRBAC000506063]|uniref:ferritin-like fold-containing protein n=1 Tax=Microbacterium sp. NIBRBAC000506063 TaxID=2734618 RepID=UPI001CB6D0ED|nr:ferritin-like fold-containing protein [Microbacterium sp. NIBRBAC000506063]